MSFELGQQMSSNCLRCRSGRDDISAGGHRLKRVVSVQKSQIDLGGLRATLVCDSLLGKVTGRQEMS